MPATKPPNIRLLIIDDDEDDFFITSEYLKQIQEYQLKIEWCYRYNDAIQHLHSRSYDIYFVDYRLGAKTGLDFLKEAVRLIKERNFRVVNVDSTINLEKPKLRPHIEAMRVNLARILEIDFTHVSIKAKTGEKVDAVGESRAVKAEAVVLLEQPPV